MATSLQTRVRQLEGGGGWCPACGFDGDWGKVKPHVEPHATHDRNEYCGTCDRPTRIVVSWGDEVWAPLPWRSA